MRIFVSGASEFIGEAVVSELAKRGHEVIALVKDEMDAKLMKSAGAIKSIKGDLIHGGEWCDTVKDVDKIISLDRPVEYGEKLSREKVQERGVRHTEAVTNLIKAASEGSAKGIVITYDTQCFGERCGKWVEGDPGAVEPMGYARPFEDKIGTIEQTANESGLSVVSVYPALVYGAGGWLSSIIGDLRSGKAMMVAPGDNYLNLIHIDDLADLYALIVEKVDWSDTFVLSDNMPVTQRTLLSHLSDLLDVDVPKLVDYKEYESRYGYMAAEMMSISTRASSTKAITVLGFRPSHRSYELGLISTLKSMGVEPRRNQQTMLKGRKAA
jgi:nucleoside-diphosphate-sugar epimerase